MILEIDESILGNLEQEFFSQYSRSSSEDTPVIFLLGASRTGSTFLYQAMIHRFRFTYFSNLANDAFPVHPIVAVALQHQLCSTIEASFKNRYGKTDGQLQPSEASYVHQNWFAGNHPAQIRSKQVLPDRKEHFVQTISAAHHLTVHPLIIKNAWNCFRIENLASLFPNAFFIWIRRDLKRSAISDLATRYKLRADPTVWNSATPANYEALQREPYWVQVVENQYEFNLAVSDGLTSFAAGRYYDLWYEDLCKDPEAELEKMREQLAVRTQRDVRLDVYDSQTTLDQSDKEKIESYISKHSERLGSHLYTG